MESSKTYRKQIVWFNVFKMTALHTFGLIALTQVHKVHYATLIWSINCLLMTSLGITAGAHRLWTHRSYKARLPLRILLTVFQAMALQNSTYVWARDHRVHHKYSETDADPHNAKRGFFFSHVGWMLVRKHPDVTEKGKSVVLDDLYDDHVLMFQHRYYSYAASLCGVIIPTFVPLCWGESLYRSYLMCVLRLCIAYNCTWSVNSIAHMYGNKPYDKSINPSENMLVAFWAAGEGFHNYHHVFPYDYETGEFGLRLNPTTAFIRFMTLIGQAYDCRKAKEETIMARRKRTGDLLEAN